MSSMKWKTDITVASRLPMGRGYLHDPESGQPDLTVGSVVGCIVAIAFVSTLGLMTLFVVSWGCNHGAPCPTWKPIITWLLVGGATLLVFWLVRRVVDAIWVAVRGR